METMKLLFKKFGENIKLLYYFRTLKRDKSTLEYFRVVKQNKQNIINIKAMRSCLKKINIPIFWNVNIYDNCLLIIHYNDEKENDIFQNFNYLCKQVEKFGKVKKSFDGEDACLLSIDGLSNIKYKGGIFSIKIVQMQVDKCDIEWKEETVKKATMSGLCKELLNN